MLSAQFGIGGRVRTAKQHGAFGQLIQGFSSILEQHHDGFKVRGIGVAADLADTRRNVGGQLGAIQRFYIMRIDPVELLDRKSVVSGKSVSVRVDLGGRSIIKKKELTDD